MNIPIISEEFTPTYTNQYSPGANLYSTQKVKIPSNTCKAISTGIKLAIPKGYFGKIECRQSYEIIYNATIRTSIIHSDYRGTIYVLLQNNSKNKLTICPGDHIAQLLILPHIQATFTPTNEL